MESISIFELIKIGIGPSSSHTMGPWRAAETFLAEVDQTTSLEKITAVTVHLYGSLAKTGKGHGTDIAVTLGLAGENYIQINSDLIPEKIASIKEAKEINLAGKQALSFDMEKNVIFHYDQMLDFHPNGMKFVATINDSTKIEKTFFSIGGGFIIDEKESCAVKEKRQERKVVTPHPCHSASDIQNKTSELKLSVSELVLLNEQAWNSELDIKNKTLLLWEEMKACIFRGISKSGILPGGLDVKRRAKTINDKLLGDAKYNNINQWIELLQAQPKDFNTINKWISCFALAVNEENAAFGRVVTAPTNGSAGVIPAILMYAYCFIENFTEDQIIKFILTAGEIGTLYKKGATISAAMGGCQAEIGVSSSMAAAGLTESLGGTTGQVLQAAEIAMEHHLGMTCDPIKGLVQIPCIERNSMGAIKAVTASNLAIEQDDDVARISLDDVIETMWQTAKDMNSKYKEVSEAGLANIKIAVNVSEC